MNDARDLKRMFKDLKKSSARVQDANDRHIQWLKRVIKSLEGKITALQAENERLREALSPSGATKCAYSGEFYFQIREVDEDGDETNSSVMVPWTTIKEIMSAVIARAGSKSLEESQ